METNDTTDGDNGPEHEAESVLIGQRLQELAAALGLNQRQLALRVGIDPRHFNSLWHDKRPAGLPLIVRVARSTGRSIAWVCGEEAARPLIGTVDALGRVTMTTEHPIPQGTILFVDGSGVFAPGERVLVDPSDAWSADHWLLIKPKPGGESWFAWARRDGARLMLDRTDGEVLEYSPERHIIGGVIVGTVAPPPLPPSARR